MSDHGDCFGEHQKIDTGIFEFLKALPGAIMKKTPFSFMTPTGVAETFQPVSAIQVPNPISWADEERDLTAWLGNDLQDAAFKKLYELSDKVKRCNHDDIVSDWAYLQISDHFYYMCTKFFSDGAVHAYFNPYESPYDAFMNYMNVLSDFEKRLDIACPGDETEMEITSLRRRVEKRDDTIAKLESELHNLRSKLKKIAVKTGGGTAQKIKKVSTTDSNTVAEVVKKPVKKTMKKSIKDKK